MDDRTMSGASADQPEDLIGAYVLDALDDVERRRVERVLDADRDLAAEAARLAAVADLLAEAAADPAPPTDQWARIESAINAVGSAPQTADPTAPPTVSGGPQGTRPRWSRPLLAAAAAAVVFIVGAGLIIGARSDGDGAGEFAGDPVASMTALARSVATQPGSRTAVLADPDRSMTVDVIVDANGHGFLMTDALPRLGPGETYQLWSAHGDTMVSLGMLGPDPTMAVVSVDAAVTDLALTREPIGGSVAPSGAPMASGHLT